MCCVLVRPGTFPICHRCRTRGCRTGGAFIGVRRCALTEGAWNFKCARSVSRYIYCTCVQSCIDNQLHTCSVLLRPGTFPICHRRRIRGCRTGAAWARLSSEFAVVH